MRNVLRSLEESLQKNLVEEVAIGVPRKPKRLAGFELDDDTLAEFKLWDEHACQDFAIGPCTAELQNLMYASGAKTLAIAPVESLLEDKGAYFFSATLLVKARSAPTTCSTYRVARTSRCSKIGK